MISPSNLQKNKVKVCTIVQEPGDLVVTFPRAYHGGFSEGFNCAEAVNFALPSWIKYSTLCNDRYRTSARLSIFSHDRLLWKLSYHLDELDKESAAMLLAELVEMYDEEVDMRKRIVSSGIHRIKEMEASVNTPFFDENIMKTDDLRQCLACKHSCFLSGVVCACSPKEVSCLRDVKELCDCAPDKQVLVVWVQLSLLLDRINVVKKYQEDLSAGKRRSKRIARK